MRHGPIHPTIRSASQRRGGFPKECGNVPTRRKGAKARKVNASACPHGCTSESPGGLVQIQIAEHHSCKFRSNRLARICKLPRAAAAAGLGFFKSY